MHAAVFFTFTVLAAQFSQFRVWPWLWVAPFVGYACVVALIPPLRRTFKAWRFGAVTHGRIAAAIVIALGSCGVLIVFDQLTRPDVSAYSSFLPVQSLGGIVVAGVLFSLLNATFEEIAFRGLLFDAVMMTAGG